MNAIYRTEEKMTGYTSLATEAVYQEMKESTSELHSTFARNVSHELRTPLAILYGYAEMLATGDIGELTSDQHHAVKTITDHARVLSKLVERIDVLLAIESHLTAFLPLTFAGLVAQVLDEKRPLAEQAEIVLETQVDPDTPFVWGDPQQLRQAVECLVENALKFTPRGGRVSVQLYTEAERVYLVVADTGIGMASQELEHVLDGFYQADSSTTRQYGGLGLGLTIVQAVVAEHGGTIQIESQPGQGSQFTISLPAVHSSGPAGPSLPQTARWLPWSTCASVAALTSEGGAG